MSESIQFKAQPGPQEQFLASPADIAIYGGARGGGKTYGLILEPLRHVQKSQFRGVIFRRTFPQIYQEGGPWDTSERIYPYAGATKNGSEWRFGSGSTVAFYHLANDTDWMNWLGAQVPFIGFDQLETFTEKQFFNMLASNRDAAGIVKPYIRATCNPEPDCWLSRFISWWWNQETGYPILERSGKLRWFIRQGEVIRWYDSKEKLMKDFPGSHPKSVTFIPAFVHDNKILLENDPSYLGNLMAQGQVEQERWLKGNWKIKVAAGMIFPRQYWKFLPKIPLECTNWARYWDLAHTSEAEAIEKGTDPDYTASTKAGEWGGNVLITGYTRWRRSPFETEQSIIVTAKTDGVEVKQCMEQEPAAGKSLCAHYQRNVLIGFNFEAIPSIKNKVVRAGPLSSALQAGRVYLLEGPWNAEFIDHMEAFRGDEEKNDVPDTAGGVYNALMSAGGITAGSHDVNRVDRLGSRQSFNRRAFF